MLHSSLMHGDDSLPLQFPVHSQSSGDCWCASSSLQLKHSVLKQTFGLPTIVADLLTWFLPFCKHPCSFPNPIQAVSPARCASFLTQARLFTLTVCTAQGLLKQSLHSCFLRRSGLYLALSRVLNNFRLLFFPFQCSLCSLYQKHKSFFSGTFGYFFEERLCWCPDIHLILGPVD